jgi:TolB-like protein/DNA-binding winged helix-turn-helix (wHTH) protein
MSPGPVVRFGTFELDPSSGELRSRGKRVPLQDQPAQVLSMLVSHAGEVVTREELRRALWSDDTFIEFDTALNVAVNKIRQALRDSASTPRFIETVPKRGYRFLADVHPVDPVPDAPMPDAPVPGAPVPDAPAPAVAPDPLGRSRRRHWTIAGVVAVVAVALAVLVATRERSRESAPGPPRSIAVLPFRPLVSEARDEALELGMTEAIIVKLARHGALRVPSISAVRRYAGPDPNPLQAGRELGVDTVLEGSLQRADDRLRVSVRLLDVQTGTARWARQWDLPWTDVFTVQDAMATDVARELALTLASRGHGADAKQPTSPEAYERYLRARYFVTRRTPQDSRRAAELVEEVIAVDPQSAPAQATLADACLAILWLGGPVEPFVARARQAALRAVALDPSLSDGHALLGSVVSQFDGDSAEGERSLERALELDPENPVALRLYSLFLWQEGRFDEALALNDRERALDPTSALINRNRAIILYYARRYDESIAQSRRTLELDRYFGTAYDWLGKSYELLGREREAVEAFLMPLTFSEGRQKDLADLRAAAARGGLREYWKRWLELEQSRPDPGNDVRALAWLRVGDRERALSSLERLQEQGGPWIRTIKVEPRWDPLRADPRFQALLRKARLATP